MEVEQAVFTSARTNRMSGYQLVGRSAGIGEAFATRLAAWGPSQDALVEQQEDAAGWSFFAPAAHYFAVGRTVYGGPEYSDRGGRAVVTLFLLLRPDQCARYANNPLAILRTAFALGHLRWAAHWAERLARIRLPDQAPAFTAASPCRAVVGEPLVEQILARLADRQRVAIVGGPDPHFLLESILERTDAKQRCELSFSIGLKPSVGRPFRLSFLPRADTAWQAQLASQQIACLVGQ